MGRRLLTNDLIELETIADDRERAGSGLAGLNGLETFRLEGPPIGLSRRTTKKLESATLICSRIVVDTFATILAIWLAYWLRFSNSLFVRLFPPESFPGSQVFLFPLIASIPILLLYLKVFKMYDVSKYVRILDRVPRIVGAVNAYIITLLIASFTIKATEITMGYLLIFWLLCIILIFLGRALLQIFFSIAGVNEVVVRNTLIVGAGNVGKSVAIKLLHHPKFGLRPVGFIDNDPLYEKFEEDELKDIRVLGGHKDICRIINKYDVEKVIIAFSNASHEELMDLASKCKKAGVTCSVIPRLFEVITGDIVVNEIGGIPLIHLGNAKIKGVSSIIKTLEDYVLSALVILFTWPLFIATAIAIKLDTPGPVFYAQERMGKDGKRFKCLKFRSMVNNAEELQGELSRFNECDGPIFKIRNDPRITRVGKWIRKFSIDELPQIFNVLAGHMSLVGPRPPIPSEVKQYKEWHRQRLSVKPGITGLWQINGRSETPFDEMIKFDLYYIERWTPWLDFKIIMRTITAVISSKGAY